jgi:hypothetical protein
MYFDKGVKEKIITHDGGTIYRVPQPRSGYWVVRYKGRYYMLGGGPLSGTLFLGYPI